MRKEENFSAKPEKEISVRRNIRLEKHIHAAARN